MNSTLKRNFYKILYYISHKERYLSKYQKYVSSKSIDDLYKKCIKKNKSHKIHFKNTKVIINPLLDAGFGSNFNKYLSHLVYNQENAIVIPDWRVKMLKKECNIRNGNDKFKSFCYGKEKDGNIFLKFFENPYSNILKDEILETDIMYGISDVVLDAFDFNHVNEPNLTYINSYNLYKDKEYFEIFRKKYNETLTKYIHLTPIIKNKIEDFYNNNLKDKFVISALIRCTAHSLELLENDKPTLEKYEKNLIEILNKKNIDIQSDDWRFFIATDNDDAINYFSKKYGKKVVYQKMQRLTHEQENEYKSIKEKNGKDIEGFELQHRAAKDKNLCCLERGYELLFDVYTLAKAEYFIFVNSNMSTMVSYINPDLHMIYCGDLL